MSRRRYPFLCEMIIYLYVLRVFVFSQERLTGLCGLELVVDGVFSNPVAVTVDEG